MSTFSLKNLAANVNRLTALIRGGKRVRITDGGRTVATIAPPRTRARKTGTVRTPRSTLSMVRHLAGTLTGPPDLSSDPAHLKGYGE